MEKRKLAPLELIELSEILERAYRAKGHEVARNVRDQEIHDLVFGDMKLDINEFEFDPEQILHIYTIIFGRCRYIVSGGVTDNRAEQTMRDAAQMFLALERKEKVSSDALRGIAMALVERAAALELAKMRY